MEFFPPGKVLDIMKYQKPTMMVSGFLVIASLVGLVFPGPRLGTDFAGGTELQMQFERGVSTTQLRSALTDFGYGGADVIGVQGHANQYIIRVSAITAIPEARKARIESGFRSAMQGQSIGVQRFEVSGGGDKITVQLSGAVAPAAIESALEAGGAQVRLVSAFGGADEHRYEAHLIGIGDHMVSQLKERFGDRAPDAALRVDWVGPRAGQQLRLAAVQAVAWALVFIMLYVALRFDVRFAPGAIVALVHDVIITLGVYILFRREMALTTVAACLTILGYSINDTIVIYDRIRENLGRERGKTFAEIVNISTSQVISRSIITSGAMIVSILPFLYFGTPTVKDIALAFTVGMGVGTYSTIYIAAPITEWIDRRFFSRSAALPEPKRTPASSASTKSARA